MMNNQKKYQIDIINMGDIIILIEEIHSLKESNSETELIVNLAKKIETYVGLKFTSLILTSLTYLGLEETIKQYIIACWNKLTND